jgi:transglutaminase superfamily protein
MREIGLNHEAVVVSRGRMARLIARAFVDLVFYDLSAWLAGYPRIRAIVKRTRLKNEVAGAETIRLVCSAVDIASCFYFKKVLCLHRSFVAVRLLRKTGVKADLVIGSRPVPFLSHAWAEVDGRVVNDKQGYKTRLAEMERM